MKVRKSKPGQKKPWEADCGVINGERLRKWFETKAQAEGFAQAKQRELDNLGAQALTLTDEQRAEYLTVKAKLNGSSLLEAIDFYLQHREAIQPRSIANAIADCLISKEAAGLRKRSMQQLKCSLKSFSAGRDHQECSEVTPAEIEAWLNGNGWAPPTRKTYLTDVRTFFFFCATRSYCRKNPALAVQMPDPEILPPKLLSISQIKSLLAHGLNLDPELTGGYIAPILFGGPRVCEAGRLESDDLRKSVIRMFQHKAKTRRNRYIEIRPQLKAWLKLCKKWPLKNIRRRLNRIRKAAGIPWPKNCLRHSFCSYSVHLIGARATAEASGHSEQVLFDTYREITTKEEARKYSKLSPKLLKALKLKRPSCPTCPGTAP